MDIPVPFEYQGKEYKGILSSVCGGGTPSLFHLSVNGYHWGQLWYVQGGPGYNGGLHAIEAGWRFASQDGRLEDQGEYFGSCVVSWIDSHPELNL